MSNNSGKKWFALLVSILYLLFGIVQLAASLGIDIGLTSNLILGSGIFGALILLLIGLIFLFGFRELSSGSGEGIAYVYVGILMSAIFCVIYLLTMFADAINAYLLFSEGFENWSPVDDMRPGIYLALLSFAGYIKWKKDFPLLSGL